MSMPAQTCVCDASDQLLVKPWIFIIPRWTQAYHATQ